MGMGPPDAAGDADPRFRAPLRPHSLLPPYLPVLRFLQAHAGLHGHEIIHPSSGQEAESRATALATNRGGERPRFTLAGNALHALGHASGASHGNPGPSRARGQTGQNSPLRPTRHLYGKKSALLAQPGHDTRLPGCAIPGFRHPASAGARTYPGPGSALHGNAEKCGNGPYQHGSHVRHSGANPLHMGSHPEGSCPRRNGPYLRLQPRL